MILSCHLRSLSRYSPPEILDDVELYLENKRKMKTKKLADQSPAHFYKFIISSADPLKRAVLSINGIEEISIDSEVSSSELIASRGELEQLPDSKSHDYESKKIEAKKFMGFHLGIYQFTLFVEFLDGRRDHIKMRSLRNEKTLLNSNHIDFIYKSITDSQFFLLFLFDKLVANTRVRSTQDDSASEGFWMRHFIASEYLIRMKDICAKKVPLISNSREARSILEVSKEMQLNSNDISWLAQNIGGISKGSPGHFKFKRDELVVRKAQISRPALNLNTFENRLIVSCLRSMQTYFENFLYDQGNEIGCPKNTVSALLDDIKEVALSLELLFSLRPLSFEAPKYTHGFSGSHFYTGVYKYISQWFNLKDVEIGNEFEAGVPDLTKIFEYYCVVKIIEVFLKVGFRVAEMERKRATEIGSIDLRRGFDESLQIFYEPSITHQAKNFPLNISHPHWKHPDVLVYYKNATIERLGVIDAKLTAKDSIIKLSEDIYYKYGLFLHKLNGDPLDYVVSLYPFLADEEQLMNFRHGAVAGSAKPFLGRKTVPISADLDNDFDATLLRLITGS